MKHAATFSHTQWITVDGLQQLNEPGLAWVFVLFLYFMFILRKIRYFYIQTFTKGIVYIFHTLNIVDPDHVLKCWTHNTARNTSNVRPYSTQACNCNAMITFDQWLCIVKWCGLWHDLSRCCHHPPQPSPIMTLSNWNILRVTIPLSVDSRVIMCVFACGCP